MTTATSSRPPDKYENTTEHTAILNEIKALRQDSARDMSEMRKDLQEVIKITRQEHQTQMKEINDGVNKINEKLVSVEKEVIHAKNTAETAKKQAESNTNWQTWAGRVVLGAVMLGLVGMLINGVGG